MNQQKVNEVSAAMAKLFAKKKVRKVKSTVALAGKCLPNTNKKAKKNRPVQKALKQQKNKNSRKSVSPPSPKQKAKSMAQMKRNVRLLMKNMK